MQWYLAKIIFRIITEKENETGLFEAKLRLVQGENRQQALQHATAWGEEEESEFTNAAGQKITWQFIAVSELRIFYGFTDEVELDSHLEEMPAPEEFIALQKDKHKQLLSMV